MSRGPDPRRRAIAFALPAGATLLAAGCVSLVPDTPAPTWYRLDDRGADAAADARTAPAGLAAPIDRVLLVGPVAAPAFYDTSMLAYSRDAGTRAHYQFAGWTERPALRVGVLVERRLAARGAFGAVAQSTAGIRGDLLLNLVLDQLYHDVSRPPGEARVALVAELVDWRRRTLLARRGFAQAVPTAGTTAAAAVDGLGRALSTLLDELCPWVETTARGAPRT